MLIQFSFKNYKSFKDEAVFDMTASRISENSDSVTKVGKYKINKAALIFGANASGKSGVFNAFKDMSYYVIFSFRFSDDLNSKEEKKVYIPNIKPFIFDKRSTTEPTEFEVIFIDSKTLITFKYGFIIKDAIIEKEWLYKKSKSSSEFKKVFQRIGLNIDYVNKSMDISKRLEEFLDKEVLVISLAAKSKILKIEELKKIYNWFRNNEVRDYSDNIESLLKENRVSGTFLKDSDYRKKIIKYLNSFDESIKDFEVIKLPYDGNKEQYKINSKHKIIGTDNYTTIPLEAESKGTLEMFYLFDDFLEVIEAGSVFFIDELNSKLHPLLVRNIILTFNNEKFNPNGAQLIFTTHDSWQLSNNLLRRDQIWFTDKDKDGVSSLYSLVDFVDDDGDKIRKDENFEKNYLLGKYGAIPKLKYLFGTEENEYE